MNVVREMFRCDEYRCRTSPHMASVKTTLQYPELFAQRSSEERECSCDKSIDQVGVSTPRITKLLPFIVVELCAPCLETFTRRHRTLRLVQARRSRKRGRRVIFTPKARPFLSQELSQNALRSKREDQKL